VLDRLTPLHGRAAVLEAAGDTPYTRMLTSDEHTHGYAVNDTVGWISVGPWGPVIGTLGPDAARLVATLYAADLLGDTDWLHLPPGQADELAPVPVRHMDDWHFRWLANDLPAPLRHEHAVEVLDAAADDDIAALLRDGNPEAAIRPRAGGIRHWYGIREGNRLVACGADRSRNGVGFLSGITVAPDRWGNGLGAAITAAIARVMAAEFDAVALGVRVENDRANALYERLGFTGALERVSYQIQRVQMNVP
jgi:ribosomal protein S18 acetylase RimI-like enzyme